MPLGLGHAMNERRWTLETLVLVFLATRSVAGADPLGQVTARGSVVDPQGRPIAEAIVSLEEWTGKWGEPLDQTRTDATGAYAFPAREDAMLYVLVKSPGLATTNVKVHEQGPTKVVLHPAVESWLRVTDADGKPLRDARVTRLSVQTPENGQMYVSRGMESHVGWTFEPSDASGRLNLPPLPEGALLEVCVDHPLWAQAKRPSLMVSAAELGTVSLPRGVMQTFQFVADPRTPVNLEGLTLQTMLWTDTSSSEKTLNRLPCTIHNGQFSLCSHSGSFRLRMTHPDYVVTPEYEPGYKTNALTIASVDNGRSQSFLVRRAVEVNGRTLRRDGTPVKGARIYGQIENLTAEGKVTDDFKTTYTGFAESNEQGEFSAKLPPGHAKIWISAEGLVSDRDFVEMDIDASGENRIADVIFDLVPLLKGRVVDESGRPWNRAVVRVRHTGTFHRQPVVTNADGEFEIQLDSVPLDIKTEQRTYELDVVAFVATEPLIAAAKFDLRKPATMSNLELVLKPESSPDAIFAFPDTEWRKNVQFLDEVDGPKRDPGLGRPAPELEGAAGWLNTEARSLNDFRGKWVLIDFWFTGCGPCHYDFPSVKLVSELFANDGVVVLGIHDHSGTPDGVAQHCREQGLTFPQVVDHADGRIVDLYRTLGVSGFPSYILLDPEGRIVENDAARGPRSLRQTKIEIVRDHVLARKRGEGAAAK